MNVRLHTSIQNDAMMHRNGHILLYSLLLIISSGFHATLSQDIISGSGEEDVWANSFSTISASLQIPSISPSPFSDLFSLPASSSSPTPPLPASSSSPTPPLPAPSSSQLSSSSLSILSYSLPILVVSSASPSSSLFTSTSYSSASRLLPTSTSSTSSSRLLPTSTSSTSSSRLLPTSTSYSSTSRLLPTSTSSTSPSSSSSSSSLILTPSLSSSLSLSSPSTTTTSRSSTTSVPGPSSLSSLLGFTSTPSIQTTATSRQPPTTGTTDTSSVSSMTTTVIRSTSTTGTASPTPTTSGGSNILEQIGSIFSDLTVRLVVAIGGPCILILLVIILIFCCCCCCRRRKNRYSIEGQYDGHVVGNGEVRGTHYRKHPSISDPLPYRMALRKAQEERQRIDDFVETELGGETSADDSLHYQGHSQVQHSQPYSPTCMSDIGPTQSLSKLTPFNPSLIMSQARGGISVDDVEEELPEKDEEKKRSRDSGGGDSPFMHLSDNLAGSRGRISQRSSSDPHAELIGTMTQPSQASQYSHLGLGVLHGGDVVFTNTASLADDLQNGLGMVGIDRSILASKESDIHSHRTVSPLLDMTDDTPVREESRKTSSMDSNLSEGRGRHKNISRLTSLTSLQSSNEPTKIPRSSTPTDEATSSNTFGATKRLNLSSITSLPKSVESDESRLTQSVTVESSDLQETPERQRRHTVEALGFKRAPGKAPQSRLGKLTSLEYIRASLRMKLNRMKGVDNDKDAKKKTLKSALRKTPSTSSQNSSPDSANSSRNNSFIFSNRHALSLHNSSNEPPSPFQQQQQHSSPSHHHHLPPDSYIMRSPNPDEYPILPPEGYGIPGMYPPGPGYPRGDPYMLALSPPGYVPELLSPILSVSQFDHPGMYPSHEIGILPQYGGIPPPMMGGDYHGDQSFPPQPPHYDDDDDDDMPALHSPYRHGEQGGCASQRSVTWNLETEEIPIEPENLTPSDIDDDMR